MGCVERSLEWLIEHWGLTASRLMNADAWWRRWLGLALAIVACFCMGIVLVAWLLIGKKPR